ncbi:MAG: hypothetical protein IPK16_26180 [Anaerolineales bacterium]|nr:hypothetical protein [Anaerolineales bacterium]
MDATITGDGYLPVTQRLWLGVVDAAPPAQAGIATATVGANGVTMRGADQRVTLAAPTAALPLGAQVNYVLRWDWRDPAPPATPRPTPDPNEATPPAPGAAAVTLFLPQVQLAAVDQTLAAMPMDAMAPPAGTDPSYAPTAETKVGVTDDGSNVPVLNEGGVSFFALWEITATAPLTTPANPALAAAIATEPTSIHWLGAEALLVVGVGDLTAAGVNPDTLHLWTRDRNDQPWREVPSRYDVEAQVLRAWLPHFTQVGLGQGLTVGDTLPNVSAFTTDALTGAATVHIPIETPAGLGGLAPALSVSYSSIVMDDLYRTAGAGTAKTPTGPLGLGWSLNGVSYVERTGGSLDDDTPMPNKQFAVVLNGVRAGLNYVDGAWRTNPATFAQVAWQYDQAPNSADRGNWIITTTQGIRYEFGDVMTAIPLTATNTLPFSATSANATFLPQKTGGDTYRLNRRWYLRQATDRFGNQLAVHYRGEAAYERCNVEADWEQDGTNWYTSAIDPAEILWSGQGGVYALRVRFTYDGADRSDAYTFGSGDNDCEQAFFGVRNRLTAVDVQYNDFSTSNNWHTLRRYQFGQSYTGTSPNRLTLNQVEEVGSNGTVQWRDSFTYQVSNPNQIWLQSASNGAGGQVAYGYASYRVSCSNGTCQQGDLRRAVALATTYDGLGNKSATQYTYGPANQAGAEWGVVSDDGSFLGYMEADVTHYDLVSASSTGLGGQLQYERLFSYTDGAGEARDNPDPRAGRQRRRQVWANQGAASGPAMLTEETVVQAYWWEHGGWNEQTPVTTSWKMVNNDAVFPGAWIREEQRTTTQVDGSNTSVASQQYSYATAQQGNGQYGNRTHVLDLADGQLQRTTVTEYFPNPTYNLVNLPARVTVLDSSGVCQSEVRTLYGAQFVNNGYSPTNLAAYATPPQWPRVMRTQQRLQGGCTTVATVGDRDASWAVTQQTYDQYGQPTVTRALGESVTADAIMTTTYDSVYHTFPVAQATGTAPVLQATAAYYGAGVATANNPYAFWGALAEYCAPNGVCTRQAYDEFGRRTFRWAGMQHTDNWDTTPDAAKSATVRWDYRDPFANPGYQTTSVAEWHAPRCTGNFVRRRYNGLGQLVQEQRPDEKLGVQLR